MNTKQKEELRNLMKKYLDRSCTDQERDKLIDYIRRTGAPEEMDLVWKEIWKETDKQESLEELSWEKIMQIDAHERQSARQAKYKTLWRVAAAAAVVVGLFFAVHWWNQGEDFQLYETGFGENIEFVLDDGTRINLNANSKLIWNKHWERDGIRKVLLEGEAYFDVAHIETTGGQAANETDTERDLLPFEVNTSDLTIRVLGTSFNAIQRRGKTEVFLKEGKVELSLRSKKPEDSTTETDAKPISGISSENNNSRDIQPHTDIVRMLPGEWVSYSSTNHELIQKKMDLEEPITEWKDGTLSYQDVEFRFMLQNLEDIYGKTFKVNDSTLLERRVKIGVPYEDWETVKDMMGWMLDIDVIENEGDEIRIEKRKEN